MANRGISGDTTRGLRTRLQRDVLDLHPTAVSILIGTNDLDQGGEPQVVADNLKAIVAEMHTANAAMPVVINKVMPRGPRPAVFSRTKFASSMGSTKRSSRTIRR